jgi:hypothetical protein
LPGGLVQDVVVEVEHLAALSQKTCTAVSAARFAVDRSDVIQVII